MVDDRGQELVIGAVADFIDADQRQRVEPAGGQLVGHDPRDDLADRFPTDAHQPGDLRLVHLLRQPRREVVEVARVARPATRPLDMLGQIAAPLAVQPAQAALDHAPAAADIQMAPARDAVILDLQPAGAAARTQRLLAAQRDGHDHPLGAERHIPHPRTRQLEHPVITPAGKWVTPRRPSTDK